MLLATLALGGAILGATTVAGLLMLYQIRATTDAHYSAEAIFAADSGVNWALFDFYCAGTGRCVQPPEVPQPGVAGVLGNGSILDAKCYDGATPANVLNCSATSTVVYAISKGTAVTTKRAFYLYFQSASGTLP
jgi:hypothetical protein